MLGFAVFLLGNTGDAIGLTFTPQSVITPIGSISLVSNLFFAKLLLGEKIGIRTLIAVCFIICGVIFIVVSSSNANGCGSTETMETLMVRWRQPGFVVFAIFHAFFLIVIFICVVVTEKKMIKRNAFKIASIVPAVQEQMNIHIPSLLNLTPKQRTFLRFGYPLLGSLFASWTVLLSKSVGELIKVSARQSSSNQLTYWEAWLMLIGLIVSLPCQVIYLNKGLIFFEAMYIVPIFYSVWCLSSITMGALYFREFDNFQLGNFVFFFIGVVLDITGGIMLQYRQIETTNIITQDGKKLTMKTTTMKK